MTLASRFREGGRKYKKLFLATLPRSGATLFAQHLGLHTDIFHIGESMYLDVLTSESAECSCGVKNCPFIKGVLRQIGKNRDAHPLLRAWQIIDRRYWPEKDIAKDNLYSRGSISKTDDTALKYWLARCPHALDKIIQCYGKRSSKGIFLDNTKLHNIAELLAGRSEWGIVVLLRDPRGIMNSYKNSDARKSYSRNIQHLDSVCADFVKSVIRLENRKNVTILRYEDFCSDPGAVLRRACEFIGVDFEERMLGSIYYPPEARGHVVKGNRLLQDRNDHPIKLDRRWEVDLNETESAAFSRNGDLIRAYARFGYNIGQ